MSRKPTEEKQRLNSYLNEKADIRKIELQSDETKRQLARQQLMRRSRPMSFSWKEMSANYIKKAKTRLFETYWKYTRPHNMHLVMLTAFLMFSTYVCYQMEDRYYKMKQKVESTKSFKQQQIEKEQRYLDKILSRKVGEFESVPIKQEYDAKIKYKFEQVDGDADVNTRSELFTAMRKDYLSGKQLPEQYIDEFFKTFPDLRSNI